MIINHNISALRTNNVLKTVNQDQDKVAEKLSTGMRINRAGDDALGFAVSERMRTQIRGIAQAERNVMDGVSFIQVTEGNLEQVNNILQRLRELSVQTSNGIYSDDDRKLVQLEVDQLIDEVDRLGKTAEFNKIRPLSGAYSKESKNPIQLHVGPNQNEKLEIFVDAMNAAALQLESNGKKQTLSTPASSNSMIGILDNAIQRVNKQRSDLGAYYNRLEITAEGLQANYINMVSAESRVRDADVAEHIVEFTKNQILTKSGVAMLAQANMRPEQVVKLLSERFG
ncbi:putative flagellin protein [Leptospira broomii serovar Hurstbridge str. 5399]|uniref:Flagellin n=4 Tax=Leptospira TaxID=171 RepID=V6HEG5_9LEPT|nr:MULTISPECIES: flagellin [Leptospira]EPG75866.1 putative flagellin protein [Leptospira fainei serovar Hurstbridge str. BUT 6]EQA37728.1 putative flagellin protein [Leptospira inadai serovar Lyme str. 10]EQA43283.1 putative flagellin protein [Leptospira broomii serovar Hurstbridge str. 5399]PNV76277.1 flagellin [Leptospira inadai serovar Lyme]